MTVGREESEARLHVSPQTPLFLSVYGKAEYHFSRRKHVHHKIIFPAYIFLTSLENMHEFLPRICGFFCNAMFILNGGRVCVMVLYEGKSTTSLWVYVLNIKLI